MAKRAKRRRGKARRTYPRPERDAGMKATPSAPTLFRADLLDPHIDALLDRAAARFHPQLWERDRDRAERIEQAATAEDVLDLIPIATGVAERAWHKRMRQFGPEAVPLIVARLRRAREIQDSHLRSSATEHLIGVLRWQGDAAATALLDCFDALDDYGRSLACVALGLLGAQGSAGALWAFYHSTQEERQESFFIGALWGLIDLQDPRVAGELVDLLDKERYFFELFGFLALAGDACAVLPLLALAISDRGEAGQHAAMALVSVGHRIGRQALLAEFEKAGPQTADQQRIREGMVDDIIATPPRDAEDYFDLFYRGLHADDIDLDEIADWLHTVGEEWGGEAERRARDRSTSRSPTPPRQRATLGRNAPCWCGSGKKYKHCHLLQDRHR